MPKLKKKSKLQRQTYAKILQRKKRADVLFKLCEQESNTALRRTKRASEEVRCAEQFINTTSRGVRRRRSVINEREQDRARNETRKAQPVRKTRFRLKRLIGNSQRTKHESERINKSKMHFIHKFDWNQREFLSRIQVGPTQFCASCGGLWFPSSLKNLPKEDIKAKTSNEFADSVCLHPCNSQYLFCSTCLAAIKCKRLPKLCLSNGLEFPAIPKVLCGLTALEERLCSLRLPFLQIRSLGVDRQCGLRGNVVHIPNELDDTVGVLPRKITDCELIPVQLLRHKSHDHCYLFEEIRPAKVLAAVEYLLTTPLYKEAGAIISKSWANDIQTEIEEMISSMTHVEYHEDNGTDLNPGGQETIMLDGEATRVLTIAPGHGKTPLSITKDVFGEVLSYPTIYCGVHRNPKIKLSYSEIAKSEIRRMDRRCAAPNVVLHKFKIVQNHQVYGAVTTHMRKNRKNDFTAADFLCEDKFTNILNKDLGFQMLKQVRTSPAFWQKKQKDILAMIRQIGIPTMFLTLSAAETQWPELISILANVLENKTLTDDEIGNMSYEDKASLIRRDPVTCARYFDYRLRQCHNLLLNSQNGVFSPYRLKEFYWRIEFQHRGSPHAHMLLWLENAPIYKEGVVKSADECISFIDELVSCQFGTEGIIHQQHRHTKCCERKTGKGEKECRFNFPQPPMKETIILMPFPSSLPKKVRKHHRNNLQKIKDKLVEISKKKGPTLDSVEQFIASFGFSQDDYISALRASLKRPAVFLKRDLTSVATNAYIPKLASLWRANMDAQFILDPYGCARYISSYISKSSGGVSKLLKAAADEASKGQLKGIDAIRKIGSTFLNYSEISAQEATYGVLGLPLTKSSRDFVYIPTTPPEERVHLVKSKEKLRELSESSDDIFVTGMLEQYSLRPDEMDSICLADFASNYQFSTTLRNYGTVKENEDDDDNYEIGLVEDKKYFKLKNGRGYMRKRKQGKVIRFRRYGEEMDPANYYREQLMLYWPWRNEETELIGINAYEAYTSHLEVIRSKADFFNKINTEEMEEDIAELSGVSEQHSVNSVDKEFGVLFDKTVKPDFGIELGMEVEKLSVPERLPSPMHISEPEFKELISKLNRKQLDYVWHVLNRFERREVFQEFVYGGAGMGKSLLIRAVVQSTLRHTVHLGCDPSSLKVLLSSPTGKAAFNIQGGTLHHTFWLPINQYVGKMPSLPEDTRHSLACHLRDLKLIIIDEISMMSCDQLFQVNRRLQEIFLSKKPFGGVSVMFVGDLRQLSPVLGRYIFSPMEGELGMLVGNPLWESFQSYELTEIMRQRDDLVFAKALNHLAKGDCTEEDISLFQSRQVSENGPFPDNIIHIFRTNADVTNKNNEVLAKIKDKHVAPARDTCEGELDSGGKKVMLNIMDGLKPNEAMGLHKEVTLGIGAKYMITLNIDVSDGLTNGATCILRDIEYRLLAENERIPAILWMEFPESKIGLKRKKSAKLRRIACRNDLVPITAEKRVVKRWQKANGVRTQFPVVPAEAITVWKSQGDTYDAVAVHLKGFRRKELYVALSRAKTIEGLYLVGHFKPLSCPEFDRVEIELEKLKERELSLDSPVSAVDVLTLLRKKRKNISPLADKTDEAITLQPKRQKMFPTIPEINTDIQDPLKLLEITEVLLDLSTTEELVGAWQNRIVGGYPIYATDIRSVCEREWLSDAAIDSFLGCISERNRQNGAASFQNLGCYFNFVLRNADQVWRRDWSAELSRDILAFPLCSNGHWTIVTADRRTKEVVAYDSYNRFDESQYIDLVHEFLQAAEVRFFNSNAKWSKLRRLIPAESTQDNGYDCGVYICLIALHVASGFSFKLSRSQVSSLRKYVRHTLMRGYLIF